MAWWKRRTLPSEVAAVPLQPGERRVAWARTTDGDAIVVTDLGVYLPGRPRLAWADLERASFQRPLLILNEIATVEGTGAQHAVALDLTDDTDLPQVLRARLSASVAWSSHQRLLPTGGVRVVGRRQRDQDALAWQLVYDAGTDPDDPAVRAQAEQHLLAARRTIG